MELSGISLKGKIQLLEDQMKQLPQEQQVELCAEHVFCKGLYSRSLFIPAGVVVTGKIHKHEHVFIVAQGDVTVWTEDGMKRVQAPYIIKSLPGTKRVALAHTDTTVIAVVPTEFDENSDLGTVEESMVCETLEDFIAYQERGSICHSGQ